MPARHGQPGTWPGRPPGGDRHAEADVRLREVEEGGRDVGTPWRSGGDLVDVIKAAGAYAIYIGNFPDEKHATERCGGCSR